MPDPVLDPEAALAEHVLPLGARLVSIVDDDVQHAGQAAYVRGLLGA